MQSVLTFLSVWVLAQVVMWLFIGFLINQQIPVLKVFRQKLEPNNPYEDPMHFNNACMAGWAASILSILLFVIGYWLISLSFGFIVAPIFGLMMIPFHLVVFNRGVNRGLNNDPDYLGDDAESDQTLKKILGENAGRKIHRICMITVAILNAVGVAITVLY